MQEEACSSLRTSVYLFESIFKSGSEKAANSIDISERLDFLNTIFHQLQGPRAPQGR